MSEEVSKWTSVLWIFNDTQSRYVWLICYKEVKLMHVQTKKQYCLSGYLLIIIKPEIFRFSPKHLNGKNSFTCNILSCLIYDIIIEKLLFSLVQQCTFLDVNAKSHWRRATRRKIHSDRWQTRTTSPPFLQFLPMK